VTISASGTLASNIATGATTLAHTNNAVGNVLILGTKVTSTTITVSTVTGGGATNWVKIAGSNNDGSRSQELWMGTVTTTGAQTITLTFSASVAAIAVDLGAQEFSSSLGTAAIWMAETSSFLNNGASTTVTWPTLAPHVRASELYVGQARIPSAGTLSGLTAGFTSQVDANGNPFIYGLDVTASVSPTQTDSSSAANATLAVLITDAGWLVLQSNLGALDPGVISQTYLSNVSSGTKLIAYITCGGGNNPEVTAIKDGALNAMTKLVSVFNNADQASGELSIWAMDTPAGDVGTKPTLTATATGGNQSYGLVIQEVAGLLPGNTTAMLDGGAFVTKTGTIAANGSLTANAYSSTTANEFLVFVGADSEASIITWGVPTGSTTYTRDAHAGNASNIFNCVPCYGKSTGGAETGSSALTGVTATSAYATVIGAFQLAGGTAGMGATQHRPSKSRIQHHKGTRRQQIQATFGVAQSPVVNASAGLATAVATAKSPGAAQGTVTGFSSVPGNAIAGRFTPGAPEFPGTAITAQMATATAVAQQTGGHNAGLATGAGGAPFSATYTATYTAVYGEQITTVATVGGTNAPAQIATGTGVAQQTAGHNTQVATAAGVSQQTAGHNAQAATGTGAAPAFGMAQAQVATAVGTAPQPTGQGSWLATSAGIAQQTAGHNVTLATGTGTAPQATAQGSWPATAVGAAPPFGMAQSQVATAAGAAPASGMAQAGLATGAGTPPPFGMAQAQVATGVGAALQATVQTSGSANAPAQVATGTGAAPDATGQGSWPATAVGAAPASGMAQAQVATAAGTAQQVTAQGSWPATGVGAAQQTAGHNVTAATATGAAPAFGMAQAGAATGTGTAPPFGMAEAQLASATGTAQQPTVSTSSNTNAPAQIATGTGTAQQPTAQGSWPATATGTAQQTAGHNTQLATGTGTASPFGMAQAQLAASTGTGQNATVLFGCNALAGLAAASGFCQQPAGHQAQFATALAAALQPVVSASSAVVKATVITGVTGKPGAGTVTGKTGNSTNVTGKPGAGTTTGKTGNSTSVTGKALAGSVS
jgi:hypothetical protein